MGSLLGVLRACKEPVSRFQGVHELGKFYILLTTAVLEIPVTLSLIEATDFYATLKLLQISFFFFFGHPARHVGS